MNAIRKWFNQKRFLLKNRCKVYCWKVGEKKYLAVLYGGWRGFKVKRKFEVVSEVNDDLEPIESEWSDGERSNH